MKNMLVRWITDAQTINVEEKGVSYGEEVFTQLYEEALRLDADHKTELKFATVKGAILGATGTGLLALGVIGINKLRKRNQEDLKMKPEELEAMGIKTFKPETIRVDEVNIDTRRVSKKNRDALEKVINEINENGKVH